MAHMGWSDPKTAIRYVSKSKQSAHQMAMYLCNAQRSNLRDEDLFRIPKVMPPNAASYLPDRIKLPVVGVRSSSVASSSGVIDNSAPSSLLVAPSLLASSSLSSGVPVSISSTSSSCASGFLSTSVVSEPGTHQSFDSNKASIFVSESDTDAKSSSIEVSEGLNPLPAVGVENPSLESQVASCLTNLVGSIVNSGTIHFNVSFVTK